MKMIKKSITYPVHPRVCGEHDGLAGSDPGVVGSSPRVRGTRHDQRPHLLAQRFIPACAGNTEKNDSSMRRAAVHPRVCGEHAFIADADRILIGSSPRVRGTPARHLPYQPVHRFIPACAGNTPQVGAPRGRITVHPRVCGEHNQRCRTRRDAVGSSPRVRGTPSLGERDCLETRFIPACAGNTSTFRRGSGNGSVHPRVCGEHYCENSTGPNPGGSSPRVRGTPQIDNIMATKIRFIPACAGNTREMPR